MLTNLESTGYVSVGIGAPAGTITGSGIAGQVAFFTGANSIGGYGFFFWDNTNRRLGLQTGAPMSTLHIGGSLSVARFNSGAGNVTLSADNYYYAKTGITLGGDTVTVPTPLSVGSGKVFIIKDAIGDAGTNNITVQADGGNTIDLGPNHVISTNFGSVTLISNGASNYEVVAVS